MRSTASSPRRPELPAQLRPAAIESLQHDADIAEVELAGASLQSQSARGVTFQDSILAGVVLAGSRLEHLRITDAVLRGCDLANVHARGAAFKGVLLEDDRLTGIALAQSTLTDVAFRGCRIELASFAGSRLERVSFEDCQLAHTDFLEAKLDAVRFEGCDLTEADIRGARLKRCELERSTLSGLRGVESLRGAAMAWGDIIEMAGVWAAALGIEVLDPELPRDPKSEV